MIHYVVIAGAPADVERARPHLRSALDHTSYFRGELHELVAPDRTWALSAIGCPDPLAQHRIVSTDDSFVVFNGPALAIGGDQAEVGSRLLAAFIAGGADAVGSVVSGTYNVVGAAPGRGVQAATDFTGLSPLHWARAGELSIISNRSSTVQRVGGGNGLEPFALSWLASLNLVIGSTMPTAGVNRLLPHELIEVDSGVGVPVVRNQANTVWPSPTDAPRGHLSSEDWDRVTDELVSGARSLARGNELTLLLSGGFDSRLCLAVAKAAGLADLVVAVTRGLPDHPEMAAASEAAQAAGFKHVQRPPLLPPAATEGAELTPEPPPHEEYSSAIWRRLRQAVYRFDATVCPWDGLSPLSPMKGTIAEAKGFLGEIFKGPGGADAKFAKGVPEDPAELARMLLNFKQPNDPLDVVRQEHIDAQEAWLVNWAADRAAEIRSDHLPTRFYLEQRVGNWTGPMQQFTPGRITLNLLSSPKAARAAAALDAEAANSRRFHYEVMRRTAPELVPIPFFNDRWPDEIAAEGAFDLSREPYPAPEVTLTRSIRSWQWEFLATESEAIDRLFADGTDTVLADVYMIDELRAAARRAPEMTRAVEAKSILSAVSIALAATGRAEPVCDEPLSDF